MALFGQSAQDADQQQDRSHLFSQAANVHVLSRPLQQQRRQLPIYRKRSQFLRAVELNDIVCLVGSTGCGKSTQCPQYLYEAGYTTSTGKIAVVVNRQLAAISLAERVSDEMHLGAPDTSIARSKEAEEHDFVGDVASKVSYHVKMRSNMSANTKIVFLTYEMLLHELLSDPVLLQYSAVILDDVHERTLKQDIVIGLIVRIKTRSELRRDLKIVITSACLDLEKYVALFAGVNDEAITKMWIASNSDRDKNSESAVCRIIDSENRRENEKRASFFDVDTSEYEAKRRRRQRWEDADLVMTTNDVRGTHGLTYQALLCDGNLYPVSIKYLVKPCPDYIDAAIKTVTQIIGSQKAGSILIFLASYDEIHLCATLLQESIEEILDAEKKRTRVVKHSEWSNVRVLMLHSGLSMEQQLEIFQQDTKDAFRNVICSTNIAEAGVTLPGIRFVIDACMVKDVAYVNGVEFRNVPTVVIDFCFYMSIHVDIMYKPVWSNS